MLDSHFNRIPFPWGVAFYGSHGNKRVSAMVHYRPGPDSRTVWIVEVGGELDRKKSGSSEWSPDAEQEIMRLFHKYGIKTDNHDLVHA